MKFATETEFWDYLYSIRDNMDKYDLPSRFIAHYKKDPEVFDLFDRFATEMYRANPEKGSAWLIANRMRWETAVNSTTEPFKITNDFIALYARLFMARHPHTDGFFKCHKMERIMGL